jgi:ketosteroid isomerase-like protein
MLQENVEHARQGYAMLSYALRAGDLRALRRVIEERFDPAVVLKPAGVGLESQEVHGLEVHGPESALRFLATQMEAFQAMRVEPQGFIDAGDRVVVLVRIAGRARHTGIDLELERIHVVTYRRGKAAPLERYASKQEALEAAGLAE